MALALKPIYQAAAATVARERLEDFDRGPWGQKYPAIAQDWRRNWEQVIPFFRHLSRAILYDIFSSSDFKSSACSSSIFRMSSIIFLVVESSLPSQRAISE